MTRPDGGSTAGAPWDLAFLRQAGIATAAVTAAAVPVVGLLAGWPEAVGVLTGAVLVTAFFCVSALVIAAVGRVDDSLTLPAALGSFLIKATLLSAVLWAVPADGWPDRTALAWSVVVGTLLWTGVHVHWVLTRKQFYVQPPPPPSAAPPTPPDPSPGPPPGPSPDPGSRTPRR